VKELKDSYANYLTTAVYIWWNPVKELKDLPDEVLDAIDELVVESGEGIERRWALSSRKRKPRSPVESGEGIEREISAA